MKVSYITAALAVFVFARVPNYGACMHRYGFRP